MCAIASCTHTYGKLFPNQQPVTVPDSDNKLFRQLEYTVFSNKSASTCHKASEISKVYKTNPKFSRGDNFCKFDIAMPETENYILNKHDSPYLYSNKWLHRKMDKKIAIFVVRYFCHVNSNSIFKKRALVFSICMLFSKFRIFRISN